MYLSAVGCTVMWYTRLCDIHGPVT